MFVIFWPMLRWPGSVVSFKEAVVLCLGVLGLSVGLSLALFVLLDDQIPDEKFRTLTFFFMGCVTFLTIVLQGTTMGPLLQVKPYPACQIPHSNSDPCEAVTIEDFPKQVLD